MIKIETGIHLPRKSTSTSNSPREPRYPLAEMKVGDSFQIPDGAVGSVRRIIYDSSLQGKKFSVMKFEGGYRCWRVS